jgi:hypothetical protein
MKESNTFILNRCCPVCFNDVSQYLIGDSLLESKPCCFRHFYSQVPIFDKIAIRLLLKYTNPSVLAKMLELNGGDL